MIERLTAAVEETEISSDPGELEAALWARDRLDAKITDAVGQVDEAVLLEETGATSLRAWLKTYGGLTGSRAGKLTNQAKKLAKLPTSKAAWLDGTLSGGQIDAICAVLNSKHLPTFAAQEDELVPSLALCSVGDTEAAMKHWRACADALDEDDEPKEPKRELHLSPVLDGRGIISGSLDPDLFELARTALDAATQPDTPAEKANGVARSSPERRADGFATICRFFLDNQDGDPSASATRHRPHVHVITDAPDLAGGQPGAHYPSGTPVGKEWLKSMMCDSWVRSIFMAGRTRILDYGTETRLCPSDLWQGLVARDQHCRFPGCDRPASWCAAHHVIWWEHGGTTSADNLVLHCVRHHNLIHKKGWHEKLEPDGTLWVTAPNGDIHTTHPFRQTVPHTGPSTKLDDDW